ncbi:hypothetical protein IIA16_02340 [bacterium]|nr:hypothetical protein [bacterium]
MSGAGPLTQAGLEAVFDRVRHKCRATLVLDTDILLKLVRANLTGIIGALRERGFSCVTTRTVAKELRHREQREALRDAGLEVVSFMARDPEVKGLYEALLSKCMEPGEASVFAVARHFGLAAVTDDVLAKVAYVEFSTPQDAWGRVLRTEQILEDFLDTEHDPKGISILAGLHLGMLAGVEIPGVWMPSARRWWRAEDLAAEIVAMDSTPDILRDETVMTAKVVGRLASVVRFRGDPLGLQIKSTRDRLGATPLCRPLYSYLARYAKLGHQYNFVARNALRKYASLYPALPLAIASARAKGLHGPDLPAGSLGPDRYAALCWSQKFRNSFARHQAAYAPPEAVAERCAPGESTARSREARPDCHCGRRMGLREVLSLEEEAQLPLFVAEYHCAVCDGIAERLWMEDASTPPGRTEPAKTSRIDGYMEGGGG